MPLTEIPKAAIPRRALLDASYEDVRQSFIIRLRSEQARLAVLADALGTAATDTASAFSDLEMFAHRLRGAAAVFDVPELRDAAKALELSAAAAAVRSSPSGEPLVVKGIRALEDMLSRLNGDTPASAPAMGAVPTN